MNEKKITNAKKLIERMKNGKDFYNKVLTETIAKYIAKEVIK